jgi:hypothetical protein
MTATFSELTTVEAGKFRRSSPWAAINLNLAYLRQDKTCKSAPDVAAHSIGQVEAYFTVGAVLSEASTTADGTLSRECSGFCRCRYATLGLRLKNVGMNHYASSARTIQELSGLALLPSFKIFSKFFRLT